jgi:hypothetical protein
VALHETDEPAVSRLDLGVWGAGGADGCWGEGRIEDGDQRVV